MILKNSRATVRKNPQCVEFKSSWEKRQDCMFWRNWRSYSVEYYLNWWTSSNIISTNFRLIPEINYCFFILTRRGKVTFIIIRLCLPWKSIPSYKVFIKCFKFSSKRYDLDKLVPFLLANLWNINSLFRIQKKAPHKDKRIYAVLMKKKFWVQGRVILWVIRNLELFYITANTVSICMMKIWLKGKIKYNLFKHFHIMCFWGGCLHVY